MILKDLNPLPPNPTLFHVWATWYLTPWKSQREGGGGFILKKKNKQQLADSSSPPCEMGASKTQMEH